MRRWRAGTSTLVHATAVGAMREAAAGGSSSTMVETIQADALALAVGNQEPEPLSAFAGAGDRFIAQPVGRRRPRGGGGACGKRRARPAGRYRPDDGRPRAVARRGRPSRQDRRFVAARPDPARHADFEPAPVERDEVPRGRLARPVALASAAQRRGRLARRHRQPAAAQPSAVAKPRRASSSAASCATRGRGGTCTATASRRRSRATVARLIGEGRLEIVAGRIISARDTGESGSRSSYRRRGAAPTAERCTFAYAFNCTGPLHSIARTRDPLLRSLLDGARSAPTISASGSRSMNSSRAGDAPVGAGAADQGPLLGDYRGS